MAARLLRAATTLLLATVWPQGSASAADTFYIVVSAQSQVHALEQKEVLALFTGRTRALPNGDMATPLDQQRDGPIRAGFYQALTGMDISRINSYWARLHFTGEVQPPLAVGDDSAVIQHIHADPTAIGYLTYAPQDAAVRVVLRLP